MKLLSLVTLTAMLSLSACSHHKKSCCADKAAAKASCAQENCAKPCCDKDKKCADGSCAKEEKKDCCKDNDSCKKKT